MFGLIRYKGNVFNVLNRSIGRFNGIVYVHVFVKGMCACQNRKREKALFRAKNIPFSVNSIFRNGKLEKHSSTFISDR